MKLIDAGRACDTVVFAAAGLRCGGVDAHGEDHRVHLDLLHHGFPGRLSTGGNIAFPFTPPALAAGTACRFTLYHVMPVDDLASLFPVSMEEL